MLTLVQSANVRGSAGDPLPEVWPSLIEKGTRFLRGQLCLVAAGPGTGKSSFVLNYVLKSKASCMYFSADSDAYIQLSRSLAVLGGIPTTEAEGIIRSGDTERIGSIIGNSPVRFNYEASPTLEHIERDILAYEELYGDFPEIIVIDNVLDVQLDGEVDYTSLDQLMAYLHELARETSACVIALHHVTGEYNDANKPIPLSGVKGQIGRVPELILTLHKEVHELGADVLNVSTVKNRGKKADPSGSTFISLDFDGDAMDIREQNRPSADPWEGDGYS